MVPLKGFALDVHVVAERGPDGVVVGTLVDA
jgi:hypothetical protein